MFATDATQRLEQQPCSCGDVQSNRVQIHWETGLPTFSPLVRSQITQPPLAQPEYANC